jgi:hypothetical protein
MGNTSLANVDVAELRQRFDKSSHIPEAAYCNRDINDGLCGKSEHSGAANVLNIEHKGAQRISQEATLSEIFLSPFAAMRNDSNYASLQSD